MFTRRGSPRIELTDPGFCEWRGQLLVAGGRGQDGEPLASVERFDGVRWTTLPDMTCPRLGPAAGAPD